jgi:hypothetical protein
MKRKERIMNGTTKYRIGAALSACAISAAGFGLAAASPAGAAPRDVTAGGASTHGAPAPAPEAAATGIYELFINYGSGFGDEGQLYLNSNTSWSLQDFSDGGSWSTVGQTIGLSDFNAGYTNGAAWGAKTSGTNLGSAKKPGKEIAADLGSFTWYAVFTSPAVPAHATHSDGPLLTAAVRAQSSSATFPGTYNTFISGNDYQTVYNSDGTWAAQGGFCNKGSYLSLKVKNGTVTTYTDIQADMGCGVDHLWMAKEHGTTKLGTATKLGIVSEAPSGVFNNFYAVLAG